MPRSLTLEEFDARLDPVAAPRSFSLEEFNARRPSASKALIEGIIQAESGGDPKAVSPAGAQGLMQLMPETAKEMGVKDSFDPAQNRAGGTRYINQMLRKYDGDQELALMAYNWGPGNVDRWLKKGRPAKAVPQETRDYLAKLLPAAPEELEQFNARPNPAVQQSLTRSTLHGVAQGAAGGVAGIPESLAIGEQSSRRYLLGPFDKIARGDRPEIASAGVAMRFWSPAAVPRGLIPGVTINIPGPIAARMAAASIGDATIPSMPAFLASTARCSTRSRTFAP